MRKFFYTFAIILTALIFSSNAQALELRVIKFGVLTKLNSTEKQFGEVWRKTFAPNNEALEVEVKFYDSLATMQLALNAGEINEMVLPEAVAQYFLNRNTDYEAVLVLKSEGMGLSFGFRNDNEALKNKFNDALKALKKNWRLEAIEGVYVTSALNKDPEPVDFRKFDNAKKITVAVTGDLPPIDFTAADGTPAGFNTAVLAEIGNYLKMNVELLEIDAGARTAALTSGRADVVFWYEVDSKSEIQSDVPEGVILSESYYEWQKFIHIRKKQNNKSSQSSWSLTDWIFELYDKHDAK